jgi:hypothetical protein
MDQFSDYVDAIASGQLEGVVYINVPIGGNYGISEALQSAFEFYGLSWEDLPFRYGGMP